MSIEDIQVATPKNTDHKRLKLCIIKGWVHKRQYITENEELLSN